MSNSNFIQEINSLKKSFKNNNKSFTPTLKDVSRKNNHWNTILHYFIEKDTSEEQLSLFIFNNLLKFYNGENINSKNDDGNTPLMLAINNNKIFII